MKIFSPIALVILLAANLCACTQKKDILLRTWKIEDIKLSKEIPAEARDFFTKMLSEMKANLRLTYKADGTYEATFNGRVSKGKWELDKEEKVITATDETGKTMKYQIKELTKEKFVYVTNEGNESATFTLIPGEAMSASAPSQEHTPAPEADTQKDDTAPATSEESTTKK